MKKVLSTVAVAAILTTTGASAKNSNFNVGYSSVSIDGVSKSGVSVGYGIGFGETIKQNIGLKVIFLGKNNSINEDQSNIGNISYDIGYEIYPKTTAYVSVGYEFKSLGQGVNNESVYAVGLSTGLGIKYDINDNFATDISYHKASLEYVGLSLYDVSSTNISLIYKFN